MNQAINALGLFLYALLALKLWKSGLHRTYRWLFLYVLFAFVRLVVPFSLNWGTSGSNYAYWWIFTEPIDWLLLTILVLDICTAIFHQFPALTTWGNRAYKFALTMSIVVSLTGFFLSSPPESQRILFGVLAVQRVVFTGLLLVILGLLFSLAWFRVPLKRNTITLAGIFFVFFFAKAGTTLLMQIFGLQARGNTDLAMRLIGELCLIGWIVLLTPAGEEKVLHVGHGWNPEEGERLVRQLGALNQSLAERTGRSSTRVGRD